MKYYQIDIFEDLESGYEVLHICVYQQLRSINNLLFKLIATRSVNDDRVFRIEQLKQAKVCNSQTVIGDFDSVRTQTFEMLGRILSEGTK